MSREYIQALEDLFGLVAFQGSFERAQKYFDVIESALQRLEQIDNAESGEALETLEGLYSNITEEINWHWKGYARCKDEVHKYDDEFNSIKQALLKAQQQEKFIHIITSKCVNNDNFYAVKLSTDYERYKAMAYNGINNVTTIFLREEHLLTEEEYTIVKEKLKVKLK